VSSPIASFVAILIRTARQTRHRKSAIAAANRIYSKSVGNWDDRGLLLNRSASTAILTVRFADIGLGASAAVQRLWAASDLGLKTTTIGERRPKRLQSSCS